MPIECFANESAGIALLAQAAATESFNWLELVFRWMHMLPALILVGGAFYLRLVVAPDGGEVDEAQRRRWAKLVGISTLALLVSGLYNMAMNSIAYKLPMSYNILFLVKFLLAFFVFFVSSVLAGKTALAEKFRQRLTYWLTLNMWAAILIVLLAGVMRMTPKPKKPPKTEAPTAQAVQSELHCRGLVQFSAIRCSTRFQLRPKTWT